MFYGAKGVITLVYSALNRVGHHPIYHLRGDVVYYCYVYLDPRKPGKYFYHEVNLLLDYEPFYVGKGSLRRITETCSGRSIYFKNKLAKMSREGFSPIVCVIKKYTDEQDALNYEMKCIASIGRFLDNGPLVNYSEGSKSVGLSGKHHPMYGFRYSKEESAKRWGGENNGMYGKTHTEEARKSISRAMTERNLIDNPMHRPEVAEKVTGKKNPMYGRSWINNGTHCTLYDCSNGLPEGYVRGRLPWGRNE